MGIVSRFFWIRSEVHTDLRGFGQGTDSVCSSPDCRHMGSPSTDTEDYLESWIARNIDWTMGDEGQST